MKHKLGFIFTFVIFGVWLAAHWPGLLNYDSFFVLDKVATGAMDDWFSYLYIIYLKALGQPALSVGVIGIFQILIGAIASTWIFSCFEKLGASFLLCGLCLVAFAVSPTNNAYNIFYIYDWPAVWANLLIIFTLGIQLLRERNGGKPFSKTALALLALLLTFSVRMRSDALPMLILVPFFLFILFKMNRTNWLAYISAQLTALLIFMLVLPAALKIERYDNYTVTAFLNPLAYVAAEAPTSPEEQAIIDKVVDYKRLVVERSDYEIPVLHNGGMRDSNSEQRREFYETSAKIFLHHPALYFENRWKMFRSTIGGGSATYVNDGLNEEYPFALEIRSKLNLRADSKLPTLLPHIKWLEAETFYGNGLLHFFFGTIYLPLLLCLIALASIRRAPASGMIAALVLSRLPIVFCFAPASNFKYVYGIYLAAFFLIPIMTLELRRKNST